MPVGAVGQGDAAPKGSRLHCRQMADMQSVHPDQLVSVIIPTHNRAALLASALESVARQTYRPIEVIVVDDGSTDDTAKIVHQWHADFVDDEGLTVISIRQEQAGACAARNRGVSASRGEFVQFLDSDDLLHSRRLERVVQVMESSACDFVYTGFLGFCGACGEIIEKHVPTPTVSHHFAAMAQGRLWGNTLQFTVRRQLLDRVGPWDVKLAAYQDYDYLLRVLLASDNGVVVPEVLACARRSGVPRISDARWTRPGFESYVRISEKLPQALTDSRAPKELRRVFARRLLGLAITLRWRHPDLAQRLAQVAQSLDGLSEGMRDRFELTLWRAGRPCCGVYTRSRRTMRQVQARLGRAGNGAGKHICHLPSPQEQEPSGVLLPAGWDPR
jgi:glycosyltransferase involved in cell wall biosynthesis